MKHAQALDIARAVWPVLKPHCERLDIAGSIRRKRPEVKDIEMLVVPRVEEYTDETADLFVSEAIVRTRRVPGFAQAVRGLGVIEKGKPEDGKYVKVLLNAGTPDAIALDLFIVYPQSWGYQMAIRTGSWEFSRLIAARWVRLGYIGDEGVLTKNGRKINLPEEADLFTLLRMAVPPPERRELTKEGLKPWLLG
jgi:DNA polymerase/3'-5' exonuclease PolX